MIYCFSQFCEPDSFLLHFGIDWSHSYGGISLGAWLGVDYPRCPLTLRSLFNRLAWVLFFVLSLNYSLESVLFCISFRCPVRVSFYQGSWLPSGSISKGTKLMCKQNWASDGITRAEVPWSEQAQSHAGRATQERTIWRCGSLGVTNVALYNNVAGLL